MKNCENWQELFGQALEEGPDSLPGFREHLEECALCRDLFGEYLTLFGGPPMLAGLEAPGGLAEEVAGSPCTRWLRKLFAAVDRTLPEEELAELFEHLESCTECRGVWSDLSLMHQAGAALKPPGTLLNCCLRHEQPRQIQPVLGRKTASAAAYFLAVLASLVIGNPVTFARYSQTTATVRHITAAVSPELSQAVRSGRGEFRVMLWRCLRWGQDNIHQLQHTWNELIRQEQPEPPDRN